MTPTATIWPAFDRPSEGRSVTFAAILARVRQPRRYAGKAHAGRWAGAEFRGGYRSLANFIRASCLVLDFDHATTRAQILDCFRDFYGFAHTTWTAGRWRVALVLDHPISLEEDAFARTQRAAIEHAEQRGLTPETGQSAAHCFALPAIGGAQYEHVELTGALFDVGAAVERFPKPEPPPPVVRTDRTDSYAHRLGRASRYLATMPGAISGSRGHATTFRAALVLVRGFALDLDDALRLLVEEYNPRCAPAWSLSELRHKVRSATTRARLPRGWLADRPFTRGA